MSSNEPQVEHEKQPSVEPWADCLQWMAAMRGGSSRPSAACCGGASDQQPVTSEEQRSGRSCRCRTAQPEAAASGPEMV